MSIPLFAFLIPYAILVFILGVIIFFCIYHLVRFGFLNNLTVFMSFVFIAVFALILFISYQHISAIDWRQPLQIFTDIEMNAEIPDFQTIPGL